MSKWDNQHFYREPDFTILLIFLQNRQNSLAKLNCLYFKYFSNSWCMYQVDLVLFGHVHNYERTCAVYRNQCKAMPKKGADGVDTYDNNNYEAPVHAIIGMAGFKLDSFPPKAGRWSISRISEFGYARVHTTKTQLDFEVFNKTMVQNFKLCILIFNRYS
ncbi:putative phosphodiesterase I [Helianthus annuus]|nr:putative phosphodiesterase I [Helianthus annuus]